MSINRNDLRNAKSKQFLREYVEIVGLTSINVRVAYRERPCFKDQFPRVITARLNVS